MQDASRHTEKTEVRDRASASGRAIGWPDVLRVLPGPETRSYAVALVRRAGFSADAFGHLREARAVVADALTRTEDWLEIRGGHVRERAAIRDLRRRLERELWP